MRVTVLVCAYVCSYVCLHLCVIVRLFDRIGVWAFRCRIDVKSK